MAPMINRSDAETDAIVAGYRAREEAVNRLLAQHTALFAAVQQRITPLWEALTADKTFTQKPSFSLRLFAADGQSLVGISPTYNRRTKTVDCTRITVEVIGEVVRYLATVEATPFYQLRRQMTLVIQAGATPRWTQMGKTAEADVEALLPPLEQFLADPPAVLSRSTMYCAICGRHLTDGQSRARGVGPECLRHVSTLIGAEVSIFDFMQTVPASDV